MLAVFVILTVLFIAIGLPLFGSLGFTGLIYLLLDEIPSAIAFQKMFAGIDKASLLAIPFFILSGELMNRGGLAKRLVRLANSLVGNIYGGLAITSILCCMFFAAVSGSGPATAAAIGAILIPAMVANGYDKGFASSVIAAASPMGIIIPPSIAFVVYGTLSGASIGDMYKAGFPAGFIFALCMIVVAYVWSRKRGYKGDAATAHLKGAVRWKEIGVAFLDSLWALGMPVIIVGGVFGGFFTPTESAVVAVVYSLLVGLFIYKELKIKDLYQVFLDAAKTTTSIMLIMAAAAIFAYVLTYIKVPQMALNAVIELGASKGVLLVLINLLLLVMGCFLEASVIQNITVPILLPILALMEVDLVHFGIIMSTNMAIGMLTPPFGICLFTAARVGKIPIQEISRKCIPFLIATIVALMIITFFPQLIMFAV